jgi:hypothetical protein
MRGIRTIAIFAGLALAPPLLQACGTTPAPVPPTFNEVVDNNPIGIRTGRRADETGAAWQFHNHSDELDSTWCADLAVAPDGKLRYLALLHQAPGGNWLLSVRAGLGAQTWSTTFSGIGVPDIVGDGDGPVRACQRVRIAYLKDKLYAIVWIDNGVLHNALFDAESRPRPISRSASPNPSLTSPGSTRVAPRWPGSTSRSTSSGRPPGRTRSRR